MTTQTDEKPYVIPPQLEEYATEINSLLDVENPVNFVYLMPTYRKKIMKHMTTPHPALTAFLSATKIPDYTPSINDHKLRYSLWTEFDRVAGKSSRMDIFRIHNDVCSDVVLLATMNNPNKFFFIMSPPGRYQKSLEACLMRSSERLFEIIELPITDKNGKPNVSVANLVLKAHVLLDLKVNGPMKQRIEHTHKVSKDSDVGELSDAEKLQIKADVEAELIRMSAPINQTIKTDVEVTVLEKNIIEHGLKNAPRNY